MKSETAGERRQGAQKFIGVQVRRILWAASNWAARATEGTFCCILGNRRAESERSDTRKRHLFL